MHIEISTNVNDSTYCRTEDAAPTIGQNSITIYTGNGTNRSWGRPGTTSTVVLGDDDFCAIHVGYHHKHGGGQFWRYYTTDGETISLVEWRQIPDEQRQRILDAYDAKAPGWAKAPGKLRANYVKPSSKVRTAYKLVEQRVDGTMASLYDGETVYTLGKRLAEAARGDAEWNTHRGGYYSYPTAERVLKLWNSGNLVPEQCYRAGTTVALLECEISGTLIEYANGKVASTYLKPVKTIDTFVYQLMEQAA